MKKRILSFLLALVLGVSLLSFPAHADEMAEPEPVEIYLSISHDAGFVEASNTSQIMTFKKMSVPYFDLALYGLQQYYFVSESYEKGEGATEENPSSNLSQGNAAFAYGKVTLLHALIYATEVYYCDIDPKDAGKGMLKESLGGEIFNPTGSTGSMYITNFWGMNENFNYYHNYEYPLASPGWGSTADQILLHDGDIVTLGHFTSWNFHLDKLSVFNLIKAGEETVKTEVKQGEPLELTVYRAGAGGNYSTVHVPVSSQPAVYWIAEDDLDTGIVSQWNYLGNADANGKITVDTSYMEPGEYYVCVAGMYGQTYTGDIVSTPGGIILTVTEPPLPGDANGDGSLNVLDALRLKQYLAGQPGKTIDEANADVTGDGQVNLMDALRLAKHLADPDGVVLG